MKKYLIKKLIPEKHIWKIAGNIAERFHDKGTGEFEDLQNKLWSWISFGIYK